MPRQVLAIDLRDDPNDDRVVETYREHHRRVWPEVLESLRVSGVIDMQIYLLGRRLVMVAELEDGADLRRAFEIRMASHPRVGEWERLMMSLQRPAPGAAPGEWWTAMELVFEYHEPATRA
jgi:L-rhamnose mutarotase